MDPVVVSRYLFYSQLLLAATYLALLDSLGTRVHVRRALVAGVAVAAVVNYSATVPKAHDYLATQRVDAAHEAVVYRLVGKTPFPPEFTAFPRADLADLLIGFNVETGGFGYPETLGQPSPEADVDHLTPKQDRSIDFDYLRLRNRNGVVALRGYADLREADCRHTETLMFITDGRNKRYFRAERYRSPVDWFGSCRFFAGVLDLRSLPPGEYRLGTALAFESRSLYEALSFHKLVMDSDENGRMALHGM